MTIQTENRPIGQVFRDISQLAKNQIQSIKNRQDQNEDEESFAEKDYMGDFATEEYVIKNVRVIGGPPSIDNVSEHTSKYYSSAMGGEGMMDDVEEAKHNQEAQHQIQDQRTQIKEKKREEERRA